ncbi:family 16 glycosylhydrolase [bacterium]|nr:family 16 glycosylhydrolase [bacterium]
MNQRRRVNRSLLAVFAVAVWMAVAGSGCARAQTPAEPLYPTEVYHLIWNDEFDGPALDETEWDHRSKHYPVKVDKEAGKPVCLQLPRNAFIEDGKLKIRMKVEDYDGIPNTAGGIITKRRYKYGYYEVSAKMDEVDHGWHEAFWSALGGNGLSPEAKANTRWFEMDGFEHYSDCGPHSFSYGLIEWKPARRSLTREMLETDVNVNTTFNRYGMEYAPDYFAFYFNDALLQVADISDTGHADMTLWLTAVSTRLGNVKGDGECFFDYLRCYAIDYDSADYEKRKERMQARMKSDGAALDPTAKSDGVDLWIEAEHFADTGGWKSEQGRGTSRLYEGKLERLPAPRILHGQTAQQPESVSWEEKTARTMVEIPEGGTWQVWVRGQDFEKTAPGSRYFNVAVNGKYFEPRMGTHGKEGLDWQLAGKLELEPGLASIEIIDTSLYWARADKILLTTDGDYVPEGPGNAENVKHTMDEKVFRLAKPGK